MAKLHLFSHTFPKAKEAEYDFIEVSVKSRPNRTFKHVFEIWSILWLKRMLADEQERLRENPDMSTDKYDNLVDRLSILKRDEIKRTFCIHEDGFTEIFLDTDTFSRQNVEVAIKEFVIEKGIKIGQIKWKRVK